MPYPPAPALTPLNIHVEYDYDLSHCNCLRCLIFINNFVKEQMKIQVLSKCRVLSRCRALGNDLGSLFNEWLY